VQGAELDVGAEGRRAADAIVERVPDRLRREVLLREVERDQVDHRVVRERLALVGDHLLGHRDVAECKLGHAAERPLLGDRLDEHHRLLLRLRVPVAIELLDQRPPTVNVELAHLV
jgi:hypothetical protein